MGLLDGKVVWVTGAARGQGRAHAVLSAREGADVLITDLGASGDGAELPYLPYGLGTADELGETAKLVEAEGRRALALPADVRSQAELDAAVARGIAELGAIDALVANHGIFHMTNFWELSEEQWGDMIDINLSGVWRAAKAVTPHMIERLSGSIVMTSSRQGVSSAPLWGHYVAAKHGVIGLMKAVARELGPYGVRCNAVLPGTVLTPLVDHQTIYDAVTGHEGGTREDFLRAGYHQNGLRGRTWMAPEEIAKAALYLNSDLASSVTGVQLLVDSGAELLDGYNHSPIVPELGMFERGIGRMA